MKDTDSGPVSTSPVPTPPRTVNVHEEGCYHRVTGLGYCPQGWNLYVG